MSIGHAIAGLGTGTRMWAGVVTSLNPFEVDSMPVAPPGGWSPRTGDRVVVFSQSDWSVCGWYLPEHALPDLVTVTATSVAGRAGYLAATDGTRAYQLPYTGSVTVGDKVSPDWTSTLGRVTAPPSPPPPPPPPPSPPPPPEPVVKQYTRKFRAIQAGSWHFGSWERERVRQWYWPGVGDAENRGAWFYGGEIRQYIKAGATIQSARIYLPRVAGGVFAAQTAHLYAHGSDRFPGGDVTRTGSAFNVNVPMGAAWYKIPVSLAQGARNGGISIVGSPYVVFAGLAQNPMSGQLEITWSTGG